MTNKLILSFATVALAAVSAADSYRVTLFQPSVVNGTTLKPGEYRVEVKENKATIKGEGNKVEADVRTEASADKFGSTAVRYTNDGGRYKVEEIRVGGTKTKLIFATPETRPAGE